jgi:hypothetical protein
VRAIPAQPASWSVINLDVPLVEDGALLLRFARGDVGGSPDGLMLVVNSEDSSVLPGTLEMLELSTDPLYAVFHFDESIGVDRMLFVSGSSSQSSVYGGVAETTDAFAGALPSMSLSVTAEVARSATKQLCCMRTLSTSPIGPITPPCLVTRAMQLPALQIDLGLDGTSPVNRQYLYRAALTSPELKQGAWSFATTAGFRASIASSVEADEYCYRVEAYRITDGELVTLAEACVPHTQGTLTEVGPDESTIMATLDVRGCTAPHPDLLQAWCDANREICGDPVSPASYHCMQAMFDAVCEDHPDSGKGLVDVVEDAIGGSGGSGGMNAAGQGASGGASGAGGNAGSAAGAGESGSAGAAAGMGGDDGQGVAGAAAAASAQADAHGCGSANENARGECRKSSSSGCSAAISEHGGRARASGRWLLLGFGLGVIAIRRRLRSRA